MARPTLYKPEYISIIENAYECGMTQIDVAKVLGVDEHTLARWTKTYPEVEEAKERGCARVVNKVVNKLVDIALHGSGNPQITAVMYFLNNRASNQWQHLQRQLLEVHIQKPESMDDLTLYNQMVALRQHQRELLGFDKIIDIVPNEQLSTPLTPPQLPTGDLNEEIKK